MSACTSMIVGLRSDDSQSAYTAEFGTMQASDQVNILRGKRPALGRACMGGIPSTCVVRRRKAVRNGSKGCPIR